MTETLTVTSSVLLRRDLLTKNFSDLQSLDWFDDGFFNDNLANLFSGFISYSLDNRFGDGFFKFLDNLVNFVRDLLGLQSLDNRFDDGFFSFLDNLVSFSAALSIIASTVDSITGSSTFRPPESR